MKTTSNIIRRATVVLLTLAMTMTAQTAWADTETVTYIDADGNTRTVQAVALNGNETTTEEYGNRYIDLAEGWYFVGTNITYSNVTIRPQGNVNLILANGCTMNIGTAGSPTGSTGIERGELNITLTIYGQSLDPSVAGTLSYVDTGIGIRMPYYTQHSGNVSISNTDFTGLNGLNASSVTLLGGTLTVTTSSYNAKAIHATNDITISGGTLSATATGDGNDVHGLYSNYGTITLGWTNPADRITASTYSASTVKVADGQVLTDGSGHFYSGTLSAADISAIAGQTLRPYSSNDFSVNDAGTEYTIHTATGWDFFCDALQDNANHFTGKTVKLGADITVTRMAGGSNHAFTGTFDGQGHTLTLDYGTADEPVNEEFVAPFVEVTGGAKFTNLNIGGHIYAAYTGTYDPGVGGLIGHLFGGITIEDCTSTVTVNSTKDRVGGFVGLCEHAVTFTNCKSSAVVTCTGSGSGFVGWSRASKYTIAFEGCLFDGKVLKKNNVGSGNGGFIGWTGSNKTVTIKNSLVALDGVGSMASGNSTTFARGWDGTFDNSYYTQSFGAAQGVFAYVYTPATVDFVPANVGAKGTAYDVSGITAYADGLKYNGKFYLVKADVTLADDADNSESIIDNQVADVTLAGRTLYKDGSWNTLCLPFDVTVSGSVLDGDDVVVKTLTDSKFEDGTLTMNFSTTSPATLTAGTPYIIKWTSEESPAADLVNPVFTGVTVSSTAAATETTTSECVDFVGIYQPTVIYETGDEKTYLYLGASNTLYYPTVSDFTVNAFRGYFHLKNGLTAGEPSSPQQSAVRAFALNFGDETTSIENGLLKIENEAGAWYDLSGRKLSGKPIVKGIYIKDGKKFVIK